MANDFARSIRELELEIDQFTNRIELVRLMILFRQTHDCEGLF